MEIQDSKIIHPISGVVRFVFQQDNPNIQFDKEGDYVRLFTSLDEMMAYVKDNLTDSDFTIHGILFDDVIESYNYHHPVRLFNKKEYISKYSLDPILEDGNVLSLYYRNGENIESTKGNTSLTIRISKGADGLSVEDGETTVDGFEVKDNKGNTSRYVIVRSNKESGILPPAELAAILNTVIDYSVNLHSYADDNMSNIWYLELTSALVRYFDKRMTFMILNSLGEYMYRTDKAFYNVIFPLTTLEVNGEFFIVYEGNKRNNFTTHTLGENKHLLDAVTNVSNQDISLTEVTDWSCLNNMDNVYISGLTVPIYLEDSENIYPLTMVYNSYSDILALNNIAKNFKFYNVNGRLIDFTNNDSELSDMVIGRIGDSRIVSFNMKEEFLKDIRSKETKVYRFTELPDVDIYLY